MKLDAPLALVVSLTTSVVANTIAPTVSLPYARYQGFHNSTSGLDVFLGIRYAQAPVGDLRWRAPKSPIPEKDMLLATSQPPKCSQRIFSWNGTLYEPDPTSVEDCLFLNVYAPPLDTTKKKLPVLVWIHGGAYLLGDAATYDPTAMIRASNFSFVAVVIQYRLGMFGFLPGSEVKKNGALNAGLLDVEFALKWTRNNVHLFGGDPERVTIWGESAGGGAVLMQTVARGGKTNPPLFKRAIASSPYLSPNYKYDDPEPEMQYADFLNSTGCAGAADTLACLRGLDHATLAEADNQLPRPVVDGNFLIQRPRISFERKQVNGERMISVYNSDEGRTLVTQDVNSTVRSWVAQQYPRLSPQNITTIEDEYHLFANSNASKEENTHEIQIAIFAEANLVCPSLWLSGAFPRAGYNGLFAVPPAVHGLDVAVYFPDLGPVVASPVHPISKSLTQSFMGALLSFILTDSPNENPLNSSINPSWAIYDGKDPKSMVFNVTESGAADPEFKKVDPGLLQRCSLWDALASLTQQ